MAATVGLAFHPWEMIKREAGKVRRVAGGVSIGVWRRARGSGQAPPGR